MNSFERLYYKTQALSLYRNIRKTPVISALIKLLKVSTHKGSLSSLLRSWASLFSILSEQDASAFFSRAVIEAALFDQNAFTLQLTSDSFNISQPVLECAENEWCSIIELSKLTPNDFLSLSGLTEEIGISLPIWTLGEMPEVVVCDESKLTESLRSFYKARGCGIYAQHRAFIWRDQNITPVQYPDPTVFSDLKEYDLQREKVIENTVAFLRGMPANNCLLYGDRGTGKSSTVKALMNRYYKEGLRVIEMPKSGLMDFPILVDQIAGLPLKFIIFIDDLSFDKQDHIFASLKAVLEGGLAPRPQNTLIYATSNRRHLLRETFSDRDGDEVHANDTIQESLSLADRFGLTVNFMLPGRADFLKIINQLAIQRGLEEHIPNLELGAERFAIRRGGRSPRCAKQYIDFMEPKLKSNG